MHFATLYNLWFLVFSHVQAAYASFLWDTEEYEECDVPKHVEAMPSHFHEAVASASA